MSIFGGRNSLRGSGSWDVIEPLPVFRATSKQACGLWPFPVGVGAPRRGVPVGKHLTNNVSVAADPISYFTNGLTANPSMWVQGKPGLGKSTLACRIIIGLEAFGVTSLVLGDLKPDYVETIRELGGQIIDLGRGRGHLNILDHEYAHDAARRTELVTVTNENGDTWWYEYHFLLTEDVRAQMLADAHGRRKNGVLSLINVMRRVPAGEREAQILDRALTELENTWHGPAPMIMADLVRVINGDPVLRRGGSRDGQALPSDGVPSTVRSAAMDHGKQKRYLKATDALLGSLGAIANGDEFGGIFSQRSEVQIDLTKSMAFNVSSIVDAEVDLQAAVLLACWNVGFGQVECHQVLADNKVVKRRNFLIVMDELWRPLRTGHGMIDRVDASTRLNRSQGVGLLYITHTLADLASAVDEADRAKASGIAERCGCHIYFGLPRGEIPKVMLVMPLTVEEQDMLVGWNTAESWDPGTGKRQDPPGLGHCLIKVSGRVGIPLVVKLTSHEEKLHNTNFRWDERTNTG